LLLVWPKTAPRRCSGELPRTTKQVLSREPLPAAKDTCAAHRTLRRDLCTRPASSASTYNSPPVSSDELPNHLRRHRCARPPPSPNPTLPPTTRVALVDRFTSAPSRPSASPLVSAPLLPDEPRVRSSPAESHRGRRACAVDPDLILWWRWPHTPSRVASH
jgi:hypothetical protein